MGLEVEKLVCEIEKLFKLLSSDFMEEKIIQSWQ